MSGIKNKIIPSKECADTAKTLFKGRILQIRQTLFNDNNRQFAAKIGEDENVLSGICSGSRPAGLTTITKILDSIPDVDANWLMTGTSQMLRNNAQSVGDINRSTAIGVNVNGNGININPDAYETLLSIVKENNVQTLKFQEQIDRLIKIIESRYE